MAVVAVVRSFVRRVTRRGVPVADVQAAQWGARDDTTLQHAGPVGDDSQPLASDTVVGVPLPPIGTAAAVAYHDPLNAGIASGGEVRRYSRNASGAVMAEWHLKDDGTIVLAGPLGSVELTPDGAIVLQGPVGSLEIEASGVVKANGAEITLLGDVKTLTSVSLGFHIHNTTTPGAPTSPPVPS